MLDDEWLTHLADATKSRLAADLLVLQKLWGSVRHAHATIERGMSAYAASRSLLDQIDGAPQSPLISPIPISE
jgi:hypothetical protein